VSNSRNLRPSPAPPHLLPGNRIPAYCTARAGHAPLDHVAHGLTPPREPDPHWPVTAPLRPAAWQCPDCQGMFPGRKPAGGLCTACAPVTAGIQPGPPPLEVVRT
jgi:hypothetical protein